MVACHGQDFLGSALAARDHHQADPALNGCALDVFAIAHHHHQFFGGIILEAFGEADGLHRRHHENQILLRILLVATENAPAQGFGQPLNRRNNAS